MHDDLHWLSGCNTSLLCVHCSLRHRAAAYLADYCVPVSVVPGRHHLRSARRHQLSVHVFSAAPFGLGLFLSPDPQFGTHCLMICVIQLWTLYNFSGTWNISVRLTFKALAHQGFLRNALYKSTFTYLLTYFPIPVQVQMCIKVVNRTSVNRSSVFKPMIGYHCQ